MTFPQRVCDGVSVIVACMNRGENLATAMDSWRHCSEIDEVILVDWSSTAALDSLAAGFGKPVTIIRVDNEPEWILTLAYNLAARFATRSKICKLDADHLLAPDFFAAHPLAQGMFYAGDYRTAPTQNSKSLSGIVYIDRAAFFAVNGYNEHLTTYGYDDDDLWKRLGDIGLTKRCIDFAKANHIPHSNAVRMRFQKRKARDAEVHRNRALSRKLGWTRKNAMASFSVEKIAERRYRARRRWRLPSLRSWLMNVLYREPREPAAPR